MLTLSRKVDECKPLDGDRLSIAASKSGFYESAAAESAEKGSMTHSQAGS